MVSIVHGTVGGGIGNLVSGALGTIAGGDSNQLSTVKAAIGGDYHNQIIGNGTAARCISAPATQIAEDDLPLLDPAV